MTIIYILLVLRATHPAKNVQLSQISVYRANLSTTLTTIAYCLSVSAILGPISITYLVAHRAILAAQLVKHLIFA